MNRAADTLLFFCASLGLAQLGCDRSSSSPTRDSSSSSSGEREPYELEVEGTRTCPLPAHLDPKNVRIVSYRVRLRGNHPGRVPVNYFYASLVTTDGSRYLASYEGCSPVLLADPLEPGEDATGMVNFPIPPSKTPETLTYAPKLLEMTTVESTREWRLQPQNQDQEDPDRGEELP